MFAGLLLRIIRGVDEKTKEKASTYAVGTGNDHAFQPCFHEFGRQDQQPDLLHELLAEESNHIGPGRGIMDFFVLFKDVIGELRGR